MTPSAYHKGDAYYRNLYSRDPDFRQLALQDAEFSAILKPNYQLDFTDPAAVKQLTKTLLKIDFGLAIELPDIDPENLKSAAKNVDLNSLQSRIKILPRQRTDSMIPVDEAKIHRVDFVMTNPPFYESEAEMLQSAANKSRPPLSACTGAPVEMVCEGGEVAFVTRILEESLRLRERVQWYTSMFGMVSSLEVMVEKLRERGIDNYAVTEFIQGKKTRRWAVAWSFGPMRPSQEVARGMKATPWRKILPPIVEVEILTFPISEGIGKNADALLDLIGPLELISWEWDRERLSGVGRASENVWSRAWRQRLSTNTVGLVHLADFRKRRAEVLEQQEREAREALRSGTTTPLIDRSQSATPNNTSDGGSERPLKKQKKPKRALVSFGDDDEEEHAVGPAVISKNKKKTTGKTKTDTEGKDNNAESSAAAADSDDAGKDKKQGGKLAANASVGIVPRALTKAALRREAAERDELRKQFLALQEAVKATEIAIPFVFYDGTNIPGGTVRAKKGDFVWVFLDKSRKVGAELGVGGDKNANARREWARVGVDDLMLVRGTMIIPHHYEFYFFIMNKTLGPGNVRLFNYSAEAPTKASRDSETPQPNPLSSANKDSLVDINTLEGADDDPTLTKVVDRRWYERNKHIYPASMWQDFDPEKDYLSEVRRDTGGNTFFFKG
ncbi:hypothetical protein VMCG_06959 [Cytospora schulzeri]|uniref:FAM50A/XAP5 C-terminal domain-containing protein n=1 Tax=Cytospora schulzeri TaxID=448051 RepID=A0A423W452_9PEZI|nr:hypothetical protein VMCG_06959 [Valsa malicola]